MERDKMEDKKRAIVFDLNKTLIYTVGNTIALRPNLDNLIAKLEEVKQNGIDIFLNTDSSVIWIDKLFTMKPEFKNTFKEISTSDSIKDTIIPNNDSLLFISADLQEKYKLEKLFKSSRGRFR